MRGWLPIIRDLLALGKEVRDKTQRQCSNPNCPLGLNKVAGEKLLSTDEKIRRQRELYRKNHPDKKP